MFKVPDWEDTPKSNIIFTKVPQRKNKKKSKNTNVSEHPKQVVQAKQKFKAKNKINSKLKLVNGAPKPNKKAKSGKYKVTHSQKQENPNFNRKANKNNDLETNKNKSDDIIIENYNSDKLDEMILDVKKQKHDNLAYRNDDNEEILFQESPKKVTKNSKNNTSSSKTTKNTISSLTSEEVSIKEHILSKADKTINKNSNKKVFKKSLSKKEMLKSMLQNNHGSNRNSINVNGNKLRDRMLERLKAAKFRYLNEKLYTSSGSEAQQLFQADPAAFQTYHEGYQQQVKKWPVKPLDLIVKRIQKLPKTHLIADMGCGEAELSRRVSQSVRSFDLVPAPNVEACDMAHTPLLSASMDVAVYCLALMGKDLTQYLIEANRVLKMGGHLLIAEVESRFDNIDTFTSNVQRLGFSLKKVDDTHQVFVFMEFTKVRDPPVKKGKLPNLTLKPCIYKKR